MQLNAKAINIFFCSLAEDEFNRISNCTTANEIWKTLQEKTWNEWYLDSGCSHHMTGDATQFSEIKYKLGGKVTFGENGKGRIIGKGKIGYKRSNLVGVCWSYRSSISYVQEEINIDAIKSHIAGQICITGMRLQDW
ncbi:hypothetical protein LINGRAHAP2_LOCUS23396 [Linum grandiflorum]